MKEKRFHLIVNIIAIFYYLFVIATLLTFFFLKLELTTVFLISVMLLSAIPDFVMYILFKQYKKIKKIGHIIWSSALIITCIVLYCLLDVVTTQTVCIVWGAFDIVRGLDELYTIFFDGKFEKKEIVDLIIAIMDVILGIILIIKLDAGLNVHLLAATISVFVYAIREMFNVASLLGRRNKDEQVSE